MTYLGEFRRNWRFLMAAAIGLAFGYTINNYLANIFVPPLMKAFGWQKATVALSGMAAALSIVFQPIAGRLVDRFGVRAVASFGVVATPLIYVLFGLMRGSIVEFFLLNVIQIAVVAATTGAVVYSRLIAHSFNRARGMALAIAVCAPSLTGAAVVPLLTALIDREGWRAGYFAAALCSAIGGGVALLMLPRSDGAARVRQPATIATAPPSQVLWRNPAFLIITLGMALSSLSIAMQTSQLKVIILGLGFGSGTASGFVSAYAIGVILGRILSGAALDLLPAYIVAAVSLSLPGIGLLLFATEPSSPFVVALAVLFLGLALGSEGDLASYLVTICFDQPVYSTVLGFVVGAIAMASALGAAILGITLRLTGSFTPFLLISGVAAFAGGSLFWLLRGVPMTRPGREPDAEVELA